MYEHFFDRFNSVDLIYSDGTMPEYRDEKIVILSKNSRHVIKEKIARADKTVREMFENIEHPHGFTWKMVYRIAETDGMEISREHFEYVHEVLNNNSNPTRTALTHIDKNHVKLIRNEINRTGISALKLFGKQANRTTSGVSYDMARRILKRDAKSTSWYNISYILDLYSLYPDQKNKK